MSEIGTLTGGGHPGVSAKAPPDRARVRRNSRLVALMKVLLPAGVLGTIAILYLSDKGGDDLDRIFSPQDLATLGAGLRVENPRFAGVTDQGEPFAIRAEAALPDGPVPKVIDLEEPVGVIDLNDGRKLTITSKTGRMRREEKTLALQGDVVIETSDGFRARTDHLDLDMEAKTATAPGAVTATGPPGQIEAGSFRSVPADPETGALSEIWFENGVRVVLSPTEPEN